MDQFLAFVIAMIGFAVFIFLIGRSIKYVIFLGCAVIAYFVLTALGVFG